MVRSKVIPAKVPPPMPRLFDRRSLSRFAALLLCIYWLAMFAGTHMPTTPSFVHGNSDKIWHFFGYVGLAALCSAAWAVSRADFPARMKLRHCLVIVLVLAVYGGLDEITQPLMGRTCDLRDWVADLLGLVVGVAAVQWLLLVAEKLKPHRRRP